MADKKPKKKLMVTPVGVAIFPKLTAPDHKYAKNGVGKYKTRLQLDPSNPEDAKFIEEGKAWFAEQKEAWLADNKKFAKTNKPKAEAFRDEVDEEGEPTGKVFIMAAMNESYVDVKTKKTVKLSPDIRDSMGKPCQPAQIWGGSKMRLALQLGFYTQGNEYTESWRLLGVQITELVKGAAGGAMFGAFGGGYTADDEDDEPENDGGKPENDGGEKPDGDEDF